MGCNPQPNFDPVNQTVRLVHTELPFAEEIKECGFLFNFHAPHNNHGNLPVAMGCNPTAYFGNCPAKTDLV